MLGEKLKGLRETKGLLQRQIAAELQVDTAYISKLENNEKPISRTHLKKLAALLSYPEEELLILWLADKLYDIVKNETVGLKSIELIQSILNYENKLPNNTNIS
jgi:transcriptional regulator with XRE-family HTH domain